MEKELEQEDLFRLWGASTGTLSRRLIGASASIREKYKECVEGGQIDLETSKIVILGDSGVGKTSLQRFFRGKKFIQQHISTPGNKKYHVETAAVTDAWEDVKDPENEQQYAASYAAVKLYDMLSHPEDKGISLDQHFKLLVGLLCICASFAFFPIGLCLLKIIGCLLSTLMFSGNLPIAIRYGEGTAISIFYRYACIEILYIDTNMQHITDNFDLLVEFQLKVLFCGLVIGFVLGFGCRAGTSFVFSFVCLKSQGSIFSFLRIILNMLYEWICDFSQALSVFIIICCVSFLCHALHDKLRQRNRSVRESLLKIGGTIIIWNIATALLLRFAVEKMYLTMYNKERVTVTLLTWIGASLGVYVCKKSPNPTYRQFYILLIVYNASIVVCSYVFSWYVLWYAQKQYQHYAVVFLACICSAMMEYTAMMSIGRSLAKSYNITFYVRRLLGFLFGAGLIYTMGWIVAFPPREFLLDQLLSVSIVIAFELWGFCQVKHAKKMGMDLTKIRIAKSKHENGISGLPMKFVLIDFGGQEEYHYFHHLFIPKEAIYIIVFNFEEAKQLKDKDQLRMLFKQIRYWLNCVLAHLCSKSSADPRPVFIVGTHRDSLNKEEREWISEELTNSFERECLDEYIHQNGDTYIFEVENSEQCKRDLEGKCLRQEVAKSAGLKKRKTSIKWLKFSEVMHMLPPILTISELKKKSFDYFIVENEGEFKSFVKYYNERGDIFCCNTVHDLSSTQFVVLRHGQSWFVDLFVEILNIAAKKEIKDGILKDKTLDYAIEKKIESIPGSRTFTHLERVDLKRMCAKLLEESHLIVKVSGFSRYLVPSELKKADEKDREALWKSMPNKEIKFGFDFEEFVPNPIFWRLISALLKESGGKTFAERHFRQTVYSDFAVLIDPDTDSRYKLELKCGITQNMILFTTHTDPFIPIGAIEQQTNSVFTKLHRQMQQICKSSFPGQRYRVGLVCQEEDAYICLWKEKGHIHMYHLGDQSSDAELFGNMAEKKIQAICKCRAAPNIQVFVHCNTKPRGAKTQFENLRKNWELFEEKLDPLDVVSYLFQERVLNDIDVIRKACNRSRREGCQELLSSLYNCSPEKEPMRQLCTALRKTGYSQLATVLELPT